MSKCLKVLYFPWCVATSRSEPRLQNRSFAIVSARQVPSRGILDQLTSIKNIRDLSEACPNIAPGRIYRSACPIGASTEDSQDLRDRLGVRCLLDLRSDYERQHDRPNGEGLSREASFRSYFRKRGALSAKEEGVSKPTVIVNQCSLLERDRYYRALITKLPYLTTASILFWRVWNEHYAKVLAIREINQAGLPGLYETILETSGIEIKQALEILLDATEKDEPAIFFCKIGKDRTGIIAAMVLACCNATADEIISDYIRSDGQDQIALGSMEKDKELSMLDTALFVRAPAEVMQQTIDYLCNQYGSLRGYMESIGFDRKQQSRLACALAKPFPPLASSLS